MKLHTFDTILLYPDGHHEIYQVVHQDKNPPAVIKVLLSPSITLAGEDVPPNWVMPSVADLRPLGCVTSKLTFAGQHYQHKMHVWFYCPVNLAATYRIDDLIDLAEEFFATKRKQHA